MWHIVRQYHLLELNSFLVHNLRVVGDQAGHGGSDHDVLTPAQHCEVVRSPPMVFKMAGMVELQVTALTN